MFLDPFPEGSRGFPNIGSLTSVCLAFPVIDNVFLLFLWDFVFGMHEHRFKCVDSLITNLYSSVFENPLVRSTQVWEIGTKMKNYFFTSCPVSGWIREAPFPIYLICQSTTVGNCFSEVPYLNVPFPWQGSQDLNIHFQLCPWGLLPQPFLPK